MTSRRAKRRKESQQLDTTTEAVAHELERVNLYVLACAEHGIQERPARALVPAIRKQCGREPLTVEQFQDVILDGFTETPAWTELTVEDVALAVGAGLEVFCPGRVPVFRRPTT